LVVRTRLKSRIGMNGLSNFDVVSAHEAWVPHIPDFL
jgi:hypothetical protein